MEDRKSDDIADESNVMSIKEGDEDGHDKLEEEAEEYL
jgi:hypothetical protein